MKSALLLPALLCGFLYAQQPVTNNMNQQNQQKVRVDKQDCWENAEQRADMRVDELATKLNLNANQKQQVREAMKKYGQKMNNLRKNGMDQRNTMMDQTQQARQDYMNDMKSILNSEQYAQYTEWMKSQDMRHHNKDMKQNRKDMRNDRRYDRNNSNDNMYRNNSNSQMNGNNSVNDINRNNSNSNTNRNNMNNQNY